MPCGVCRTALRVAITALMMMQKTASVGATGHADSQNCPLESHLCTPRYLVVSITTSFLQLNPCVRRDPMARDADSAGTDTDTSIASSAPFGVDSDDAGSVLSVDSDALPPTNVDPVPTLKGSNLNTGNGVGMPKFGLRGDDAGMFDLASDDDSDDGACNHTSENVACSTHFCDVYGSRTCDRVDPVVVCLFWKAIHWPPSRRRKRGGGSGGTVWWRHARHIVPGRLNARNEHRDVCCLRSTLLA
jgi:hypothetical protein